MLAEGRSNAKEEEGDEDSSTKASENEEEEQEEGGDEEADKLEAWHEWTQRVSGRALEEMERAGVEDWTCSQEEDLVVGRAHLARRTDGRWSTSLLDWTLQLASAEWATSLRGGRATSR